MAETPNKLISEIDERILLCQICMERFKTPKILQCFHTFCTHCLVDWVKTKGSLVCPTCKQTWPLPTGGADKIDNNCFLNDLLEIIVKFSESSKSRCDVCEKDATHWCKDCGQYFCEDCIRTHKVVKALQDHEYMTVDDYNTKMRSKHFRLLQPRFCDVHPNTPVEFYCDVCQVPACLRCNVVEHKAPEHEMITLEKAFEKYQPTMNQYLETLAHEIGTFKETKENAELVGGCLEENKGQAEKQVKDAVAKIQQETQAEKSRLLGEVERMYQPKRGAINAEIEQLSLHLASVESVHSYLANLLMYGGPVDIMAAKKELDRQVQEKARNKRINPTLSSDIVFQENVDHIPVYLGTMQDETSLIKEVRSGVGKLLMENREVEGAAATESIYDQVAATIDLSKLEMSEDEARKKIDTAVNKTGLRNHYKSDGKIVILQGRLDHINHVNGHVLGLKAGGVQDKTVYRRLSPKSSPRSSVVKLDAGPKMPPSPAKTSPSRLAAVSVPDNLHMASAARCKICLDEITNVRELPCKHRFCKKCMDKSERKTGKRCPVCTEAFGTYTGNMPKGTMKHSVEATKLPGYPSCGTIVISYDLPSGIQGKEHPNPGKQYTGTKRTAFLPDNDEGREVLRLLEIAFQRRLTFTIDTSRTTGIPDTVVWNDIRHKTNKSSGAEQYGYPDPEYLTRVKDELAAMGIK